MRRDCLSSQCCVAHWAVENLSARGIVWNLIYRRLKSRGEIKCYFLDKIKKLHSPCLVSVFHLAYFIVFGRFYSFEVFVADESGRVKRKFLRNFWLCTRVVSRSCHAGAVTNVNFKLCHSRKDGHRARRKVESSSCEAKIVRTQAERRKIFPSRSGKRTNRQCFFALDGKIEQWIRISLRKRPHDSDLSKHLCPLTSSIELSRGNRL